VLVEWRTRIHVGGSRRRIAGVLTGKARAMTDTGETPEELREEVEEELEELAEETAAEERERMAERDAEGVDEPHRGEDERT
jgi:hypothetical protein